MMGWDGDGSEGDVNIRRKERRQTKYEKKGDIKEVPLRVECVEPSGFRENKYGFQMNENNLQGEVSVLAKVDPNVH